MKCLLAVKVKHRKSAKLPLHHNLKFFMVFADLWVVVLALVMAMFLVMAIVRVRVRVDHGHRSL